VREAPHREAGGGKKREVRGTEVGRPKKKKKKTTMKT
tara:strand:- start:1522 stop:1632 length:111 start_codon:yes stop_codon:yes gene_type:complete